MHMPGYDHDWVPTIAQSTYHDVRLYQLNERVFIER